jgi:hypothetical protein
MRVAEVCLAGVPLLAGCASPTPTTIVPVAEDLDRPIILNVRLADQCCFLTRSRVGLDVTRNLSQPAANLRSRRLTSNTCSV